MWLLGAFVGSAQLHFFGVYSGTYLALSCTTRPDAPLAPDHFMPSLSGRVFRHSHINLGSKRPAPGSIPFILRLSLIVLHISFHVF